MLIEGYREVPRIVNVDRADRIHHEEPGKPSSDIIDCIASEVPIHLVRGSAMVMKHAISKIEDFPLLVESCSPTCTVGFVQV